MFSNACLSVPHTAMQTHTYSLTSPRAFHLLKKMGFAQLNLDRGDRGQNPTKVVPELLGS